MKCSHAHGLYFAIMSGFFEKSPVASTTALFATYLTYEPSSRCATTPDTRPVLSSSRMRYCATVL
ncbi:MAG: hypothetical protein MEEGG_01643 [Eggerthella lenta]